MNWQERLAPKPRPPAEVIDRRIAEEFRALDPSWTFEAGPVFYSLADMNGILCFQLAGAGDRHAEYAEAMKRALGENAGIDLDPPPGPPAPPIEPVRFTYRGRAVVMETFSMKLSALREEDFTCGFCRQRHDGAERYCAMSARIDTAASAPDAVEAEFIFCYECVDRALSDFPGLANPAVPRAIAARIERDGAEPKRSDPSETPTD